VSGRSYPQSGPVYVLCECGCGQPTRVARYSDKSSGYVRGKPMRFLYGHHLTEDVTTDLSIAWRTGWIEARHGQEMILREWATEAENSAYMEGWFSV